MPNSKPESCRYCGSIYIDLVPRSPLLGSKWSWECRICEHWLQPADSENPVTNVSGSRNVSNEAAPEKG